MQLVESNEQGFAMPIFILFILICTILMMNTMTQIWQQSTILRFEIQYFQSMIAMKEIKSQLFSYVAENMNCQVSLHSEEWFEKKINWQESKPCKLTIRHFQFQLLIMPLAYQPCWRWQGSVTKLYQVVIRDPGTKALMAYMILIPQSKQLICHNKIHELKQLILVEYNW